MGLLVNGLWQDQWYETKESKGAFQREEAQLRNWLTVDGSAGPTGEGGFKAEKDRYHLYVSLACPWAHRTLIFRELKGLQDIIPVSVVSTDMSEFGWSFDQQTGSTGDHLFALDFMHQLYTKNKTDYTGRVTVPVLWDKKLKRIVSNESSEIIRMFNSAFNAITDNHLDFYPEALRSKVDEINEWVYSDINNGVYRCGFATTQKAYEQAYHQLFNALDKVEAILAKQAYLAGEQVSEADWRLFTTLIRFDSVYFGHFKCNQRQIEDYKNISHYLRQLYQVAGIKETVNQEHIKRHYYFSHTMINPTQVVPLGPNIDYDRAHNRLKNH
ncbi:glutathione S-transferase family protein [Psychromonas sp. Urea-02u-13]|uniref:glutathione S-transferase family protein n=1 Tax=Psychromonas sp. Urea-02u-13 TaxID=2058326 RepID=UPI000C32657D|nr:glutathione S-transferase family protein [Psychromonas sp. Urea-02u-13]PKG39056.1 glutathione-dependent reductase [Psychromonas sp. Urea-02u-13]